MQFWCNESVQTNRIHLKSQNIGSASRFCFDSLFNSDSIVAAGILGFYFLNYCSVPFIDVYFRCTADLVSTCKYAEYMCYF